MGGTSERAVSIPQITYDHINDPEEKKDVGYFQDGKRGSVEGNVMTALCCEHADVMATVISTSLRTRLEFHKHHGMLSF